MANKRYLLGTLVVAGTALTACGSSAQTSAATTTTSATKTSAVASKPKTVVKTAVSAPVGFNATDTVFVLPYNLGDLPAPELALAKSDPAYAADLASYAEWQYFPHGTGWVYTGPPSPSWGATGAKVELLQELYVPDTYWAKPNPSIRIVASQLNNDVLFSSTGQILPLPAGETLVGPTPLEISAAPVGTFVVNGVTHAATCIPEQLAVVNGAGQVVSDPPAEMNFAAGPNTIAVGAGGEATGNGGATPSVLYDQGVSSCAGFN